MISDRPSEIELMDLHLRCLWEHDPNDRIVRTREPNGRRAARFHLGRTRLGNLWRFRDDTSAEVVRELARLAGKEAPLDESGAAPERLEPIRRALRLAGEVTAEWCGPAWFFPKEFFPKEFFPEEFSPAETAEIPETPRALPVVPVLPGDGHLLENGFDDVIPELAQRQPCFVALEEGRAVSICHSARPLRVPGLTSCAAAEASVETRTTHRGRGLAPRVTAAWAEAVRERGGIPLYSTSWDNRASRAVARKLGLSLYGEDLHWS